jgi:hypothetical protein
MSELLVLIAALGSSALTGAVAFGLEWWRSNRAGKAAQAERRSRAYSLLLTRSMIIAHLAADLHIAMEIRSGIKEGIDVTFRLQKALDPLEIQDRLRAEVLPLYEAWSEVWVVGSKEAIPEANDLFARCGAVVSTATQHGKARAKWLRGITGEKWTRQQLDQWQAEQRGLAEARKRLGGVARRETGVEVVDLFASNESINP